MIAVLSGGIGYYFYAKAHSDPQKVAQAEVKSLLAQISKLMVLPDNEQPIVATVADPTKLKDQPFFANAKKGDKVLIFNASRKAVLFDPVGNKIVNVAPLTIGATSTPTPSR